MPRRLMLAPLILAASLAADVAEAATARLAPGSASGSVATLTVATGLAGSADLGTGAGKQAAPLTRL